MFVAIPRRVADAGSLDLGASAVMDEAPSA
jgi:hypothetical protein